MGHLISDGPAEYNPPPAPTSGGRSLPKVEFISVMNAEELERGLSRVMQGADWFEELKRLVPVN